MKLNYFVIIERNSDNSISRIVVPDLLLQCTVSRAEIEMLLPHVGTRQNRIGEETYFTDDITTLMSDPFEFVSASGASLISSLANDIENPSLAISLSNPNLGSLPRTDSSSSVGDERAYKRL